MRSFIVIILIFHTTTAVIDFYTFHSKAATKIQNLQNKATNTFQQITSDIDLDKLKPTYLLNIIIPTLKSQGQIIHQEIEKLPKYRPIIMQFIEKLKNVSGQDIISAFDLENVDRIDTTEEIDYRL